MKESPAKRRHLIEPLQKDLPGEMIGDLDIFGINLEVGKCPLSVRPFIRSRLRRLIYGTALMSE